MHIRLLTIAAMPYVSNSIVVVGLSFTSLDLCHTIKRGIRISLALYGYLGLGHIACKYIYVRIFRGSSSFHI